MPRPKPLLVELFILIVGLFGLLACTVSNHRPLTVNAMLVDTSSARAQYVSWRGGDTLQIAPLSGTYRLVTREGLTKEGRWQRPDSLTICFDSQTPCARLTRLWLHDVAGSLTPVVVEWKETPLSGTWP